MSDRYMVWETASDPAKRHIVWFVEAKHGQTSDFTLYQYGARDKWAYYVVDSDDPESAIQANHDHYADDETMYYRWCRWDDRFDFSRAVEDQDYAVEVLGELAVEPR